MRRLRESLCVCVVVLAVAFAKGCLLAGDAFDDLEPRRSHADATAGSGAAGVAGSGAGTAGSCSTGGCAPDAAPDSSSGGATAAGGSAGASGAGAADASLGAGGAAGSGGAPDGSAGSGGTRGVPDGSADSGNDADAGAGGTGGCPPTGCERLVDAEHWGIDICFGNETCLLGDVNNDGKDDAIAFVGGAPAAGADDVWVSLTNSTGTAFLPAEKWSEHFCADGETCAVGDVDGDGRADLVAFMRDAHPEPRRNDVWVALSTGSAFGEPQQWSDNFCWAGMECFVAGVNADDKADLIGFVKATRYEPEVDDVLVALSSGSGFGTTQKWSDSHCSGNQTCAVGDINGDRRADILSFVRESETGAAANDVLVRLALPERGFAQGNPIKWSDDFCKVGEQCLVSDVTGDGRADLVAFTRSATGLQAASLGSKFGPANVLASYVCVPGEVCLVGDVTGDGIGDLAAFVRENDPNFIGDVFVVRTWGASWRALPDAPQVLSSSATLLRSDEILVTGGGQNNCCQAAEPENWGFDHSYLYDVATEQWARITSPYGTTKDAFSAGHAHDSEGRPVYYGGALGSGQDRLVGIADSARWDPNSGLWTALTGAQPFWSPTLVPGRRANGQWCLYSLSGGNVGVAPPVYRLGASDTSWTSTGQVLQTVDSRPRAFLLPDGKIFVASPNASDQKNYFYDPAQDAIAAAGGDAVPHTPHYDGFVNPAVLLPLQADANQKYSSVRVMHVGGGRAFVKEVGTPTPGTWFEPAPLRSRVYEFSPRNSDHANATVLPTGQIVVTGGIAAPRDSSAAWQAEVFGEDTGGGAALNDKWSWASGSPVPRQRHSVALLLRDGRVWVAGSSKDGTGSYCNTAHTCTVPGSGDDRNLNVEIFEPWYYGRSDRPTITACPATFAGAPSTREISVGNGEGESILEVSLMAAGSVTQSFNSDQRLIWLDIAAKTASTVTVNIPYTDAAAPPGDYMVFVLKRNPRAGAPLIPSIGCWTKR